MRERKSRSLLTLGLIGPGPTWHERFRSLVEQMSSRVTVQAVCDPVQEKAILVARKLEAEVVSSPWLLSQRRDVKAWLILDPGWFATYPAELAAQAGRPALWVNPFEGELARVEEALLQIELHGDWPLVALPDRYTPATVRLRELIATKLGPVSRIRIRLHYEAGSLLNWMMATSASGVGLFDWCSWIVGRPIGWVDAEVDEQGQRLRIGFPRHHDTVEADVPTATIAHSAANAEDNLIEIECQRGSATILSPTRIVWMCDHEHSQTNNRDDSATPKTLIERDVLPMKASSQTGSETPEVSTELDHSGDDVLDQERPAWEIIFDQFCRRAVGGLIPVASVGEARRAVTTFRAAVTSLQRRVTLTDRNLER